MFTSRSKYRTRIKDHAEHANVVVRFCLLTGSHQHYAAVNTTFHLQLCISMTKNGD